MNFYLLPHHRLDPRFQYTLERELRGGSAAADQAPDVSEPWWHRAAWRLRELVRRLKHDYDQVVHGHEQIRLSRLVLIMDRDPELTLVIPAGMSRDRALQAVRGVIRAGLMAMRMHALRNIITALIMMIVLFGATPTHFGAIIFYPLIALYAWGRYWEDRLISRTSKHLLDVRLAGDTGGHLREEAHLAQLEAVFDRIAKPDEAYRSAAELLDQLDGKPDQATSPQHALMFTYYHDIGRLDPYERYQDRIRKKLVDTAKLVAHHLWAFWKGAFFWAIRSSRVLGLRLPNMLFLCAGALAAGYGCLWYVEWSTSHSETFPRTVRVDVRFGKHAHVELLVRPLASWRQHAAQGLPATPTTADEMFDVTCPLDSGHVELWPFVAEMIARGEKRRESTAQCPGSADAAPHAVRFDIAIRY